MNSLPVSPMARGFHEQELAKKPELEPLEENFFKEMDAAAKAHKGKASEHDAEADRHMKLYDKHIKGSPSRANYHRKTAQGHRVIASAHRSMADMHHGYTSHVPELSNPAYS